MKVYFTFFLLAICICSCNQSISTEKKVTSFHKEFQKGPLKITIDFSPEKPTIADRIELSLKVETSINYQVKMPEFSDNIGRVFYVYSFFPEPPKVKDKKRIYKHFYTLEALLSGKVTIPPIKILYNKAEQPTKKYTTVVDSIDIEIQAIDLDSQKKGIYDIQSIMPLHKSNFYLFLACVVVGIIFIVFFIKSIKSSPVLKGIEQDLRTPEEIAWERLKELLDKNYVENQKYQEFYFILTMIVRQYIEKKYKIKASGQTAEEFLDDIKKLDIFDAQRKRDFSEFLAATDFVKYAAQDPQEKEVTLVFTAAKKFMNLES
ncbi:hypothetical protein [Candidatus Uabimicrobium sp. HlEnr_7]|uniref:hypothetical protein n=1 Tax=Candidatus Uabimicrobium helgolandensis TaxID=3095367 RepID=UPI003558B196